MPKQYCSLNSGPSLLHEALPVTRGTRFALLSFLARNRGRACTREELVVHVWTERELTSARTVDIHVHRLRQKLGRPFSELLETLRNVGYKLRTAPWPLHAGAPLASHRENSQLAAGARAQTP